MAQVAHNAHSWGVVDESGDVEICSRCPRVREWENGAWVYYAGYKAYQRGERAN